MTWFANGAAVTWDDGFVGIVKDAAGDYSTVIRSDGKVFSLYNGVLSPSDWVAEAADRAAALTR